MNRDKAMVITVTALAFTAITVLIIWLSANLPFGGDGDIADIGLPLAETYNDEEIAEDVGEIENIEEIEEIEEEALPDEEQDINGATYEDEAYYPYDGGDYYYIPAEFTPIFTREPLPEHIIQQITGVTFHENTPFDYSFLTYVTVTHVNFYGESTIGHLIVADEIGDEVLEIFMEIYESGFPIYSIRLIDYFGASDYYSMAANNSHGFNFRYIAGTTVISRHGFGMAIDINPIQNPYIRGSTIWPAAGEEYLDRSYIRPGMITPGDAVYNAFISRGWIWGGHWTSPRDYHHFERR